MSTRDRVRWNDKHAKREPYSIVQPDAWLVEALQVIETAPGMTESRRRALDVACGLGHNAIWLAQQGWQADGVDISANGLQLARQSAAVNEVHVGWMEADLDNWNPLDYEYDLAIVFRFLDRESVPRVVRTALRPGGWLVYETFSAAQCRRSDNHIGNPAFTLASGELPTLFPDFDVVSYREDVLHDRTVERLLGQRQPSG
jgi:SAM-dependent methyltransferase